MFVPRRLQFITPEMLQSAGMRAKTCCSEMTNEDQSVRWIRSLCLPERAQTHCYFEVASQATVEEADKRPRIPFTRITEVVEMTPDSL